MMDCHDRVLDYYSNDPDVIDSWQNDIVSVMTRTNLLESQYCGGKVLMRDIDPLLYSSQQEEKPLKQVTDLSICEAWKSKMIDEWSPKDVLSWLSSEANFFGVMMHEMQVHNFADINGYKLKQMTEEDFYRLSSTFGSPLYHRLQTLKATDMDRNYQIDQLAPALPYFDEYLLPKFENNNNGHDQYMMRNLDDETNSSLSENRNVKAEMFISDLESGSDSGFESEISATGPVIVKRKPGRPRGSRRKKKPEKLGRLWEFIRDLLLNAEYCPSLICWDNYEEGMFRFVHSDKVAKLWGSKKDNPDMNYEKLSRAMRYYYKSQVLLPVLGRRLVYKFGPTATGWRTPNPNFRGRG